MRLFASIVIACSLIGQPLLASKPDSRRDGALPESSRWSSFARIAYGRWDTKSKSLRGNAAAARQQFRNCVDDAWFIAYSPLLFGRQSPCIDLARTAHATEDDGSASSETRERFRVRFSSTTGTSDFSGYNDCVSAAFDHVDSELLSICALALRPRERVLATLTDEERFSTWFGSCKKILLADVRPVEAATGEALKTPRKEITEFERTQGRHCFRLLPALYEVRGMKKLSDYWTPEEQKSLFLRSRQLGQ